MAKIYARSGLEIITGTLLYKRRLQDPYFEEKLPKPSTTATKETAMSPRANFRRTMTRVQSLIRLNRNLQRRGRPPKENQDLLRATVVLSLGALDAVVADVIVDAVPAAAKLAKIGQQIQKWIEEKPEEVLLLFTDADPAHALAGFTRDRLADMTLQYAAAIDRTLRETIQLKSPWAVAGRKVGLTPKEIKDELDGFVARRNDIAHRGDVVKGGTALQAITLKWVEDRIGYVSAIGEDISDIATKAYGPKRGRPKAKKI